MAAGSAGLLYCIGCVEILCMNISGQVNPGCFKALNFTPPHTLIIHIFISAYDLIVTLPLFTSVCYKNQDASFSPLFPTVSKSLTGAALSTAWCAGGESVKMAVLIRRRIRAVVFNQSSQWQRLWCSRGDCDDDDDDSCLRGKHWKYTCTLICAVWSRAYSAISVLRAAVWGEKVPCRKGRGF